MLSNENYQADAKEGREAKLVMKNDGIVGQAAESGKESRVSGSKVQASGKPRRLPDAVIVTQQGIAHFSVSEGLTNGRETKDCIVEVEKRRR